MLVEVYKAGWIWEVVRVMKRFLAIAFLTALLPVTQADEVPAVAVPGAGALLSAELIYPLDDTPTPQCHASTIA